MLSQFTSQTTPSSIKNKLVKQWDQFKFHKAWLHNEAIFPLQIKLTKPTNKQLLHDYDQVKNWLDQLKGFEKYAGINLIKQQVNYSAMGKQFMPILLEFTDIEALMRYLGKWKQWQEFIATEQIILQQYPQLKAWLGNNATFIVKYHNRWRQLMNICQYFLNYPQPNCYIRQLNIAGVDTKFIEQHKRILKSLLDELLPQSQVNIDIEKLAEHGFEKRFGLLYEQPQIRFRLLDPLLAQEFSGVSDLSMPIEQFQQLNLLIDKVYITENKINGLAFPPVNNAIVIFGLGYGIQSLKQVNWLNTCQIHYWGDIDSHGFAILSQLRGYFAKAQSLLMDEVTLLSCKEFWGQEPEHKSHKAQWLANLNEKEQALYKNLKQNKYQPCLRLEQERIPFLLLEQAL